MLSNIVSDISKESYSIMHTPALDSQKLPFYVLAWGHFYAQKQYYVEREGMGDFLVIYTLAGTGKITYEGKNLTVSEGDFFVLDLSKYHCYKTSTTDHWELLWFRFNGIAAWNYVELINRDNFELITPTSPGELYQMFNSIPSMIEKGDILSDTEVSRIITNILTDLLLAKSTERKNSFSQNQILINRIIKFIEINYYKQISVKEISKTFNIDEFHMTRIFNRQTGTSPYSYLTRIRVNISKQLLQYSDLSVNQIAEKVGYQDVNNYIRNFKILTGTTPLKFRKYDG